MYTVVITAGNKSDSGLAGIMDTYALERMRILHWSSEVKKRGAEAPRFFINISAAENSAHYLDLEAAVAVPASAGPAPHKTPGVPATSAQDSAFSAYCL